MNESLIKVTINTTCGYCGAQIDRRSPHYALRETREHVEPVPDDGGIHLQRIVVEDQAEIAFFCDREHTRRGLARGLILLGGGGRT